MYMFSFFFFFFFQAEDGIRDTSVTGVQTCALPIWEFREPRRDAIRHLARRLRQRRVPAPGNERFPARHRPLSEIGRASCRERVWISVVAVAVKKKKE